MKLAVEISPRVDTAFDASNVAMMSMLLGAVAKEAASGIANRMADAEDIVTLFTLADQAPGAASRAAFQASEPPSLLLQDVTSWLDEGLGLLIDLHAWAEQEDKALNLEIWNFLARHAERHRIEP